jgi:hypothetical protein
MCFLQAYSLAGMGCGAGVIGIHLVRDILQAHPGANALFICAGACWVCALLMCTDNSAVRCTCNVCAIGFSNSKRSFCCWWVEKRRRLPLWSNAIPRHQYV